MEMIVENETDNHQIRVISHDSEKLAFDYS